MARGNQEHHFEICRQPGLVIGMFLITNREIFNLFRTVDQKIRLF